MKRKIFTIIAGVIVAGIMVAGTVAATGNPEDAFRTNKTLRESEVVDGSYYAAGDTVTVAGTVKGDVYCAGKTVIVSGKVEGDVLCAGQTVKVSGTVGGDIRVAGQFVTLDGTVSKNASLFGSTVDITKSGKIVGDANGAGETINLDGEVGRDAVLGGNTITVTGMIGRNSEIASENFTVGDGAVINGNIHYTSRNEAAIAEGSVKGKVDFTKQTREDQEADSGAFASVLYMIFSLLFVSLVLVLAAPQLMNSIGTTGLKKPGIAVATGILILLAVPFFVVLAAITVVGIPLAIILALAWVLILMVSGPVTAYYLGRLIIRKYSSNAVATMMTGALVLSILLVIPVIGLLTGIASAILGSGMIGLHMASASTQKKFSYSVK